jgi:hypothetical protein
MLVDKLIKGKGPEREHYENLMKQMNLSHAYIQTMWLAPGDYPLLLG